MQMVPAQQTSTHSRQLHFQPGVTQLTCSTTHSPHFPPRRLYAPLRPLYSLKVLRGLLICVCALIRVHPETRVSLQNQTKTITAATGSPWLRRLVASRTKALPALLQMPVAPPIQAPFNATAPVPYQRPQILLVLRQLPSSPLCGKAVLISVPRVILPL